jgi:hypothetical protein
MLGQQPVCDCRGTQSSDEKLKRRGELAILLKAVVVKIKVLPTDHRVIV